MRAILASAFLFALTAPALAEPPPGKQEADPQAKRITGSENYIATFGLRASISHGYSVSGVLAVAGKRRVIERMPAASVFSPFDLT
jgi:hypothetical protein